MWLTYLTAGTSVNASVALNGNNWELTLTGGTDINEYLTVLNSVTYENSSDNPSTSARTLTVKAFDESYANISSSDEGSISVTAVNDAPEVVDNSIYTVASQADNGLNITPPTDPDTEDSTLTITVTGLPPAGFGTVTLAGGGTVNNGDTLTMAELTSLEFDATATTGSQDFTYTVYDGEFTTTGTTTINVGDTGADVNTVYESSLDDGTAPGSSEVTGNLFTNDASSGDTLDKVTFNSVDYAPNASGIITIDTPLGTITVYANNNTAGHSVGDYVYTLEERADNSAAAADASVTEQFDYYFTNNTVHYDNTLTITIVDDAPIANAVVQEIPESEEKVFNLILTLDDSGSMDWGADTGNNPPDAGESSRMEIAKEALKSLAKSILNNQHKSQLPY